MTLEASNFFIGYEHIDSHVMFRYRDRFDHLFFDRQTAGDTVPVIVSQEGIIESPAPANPVAVPVKPQARYDDHVDVRHRNGNALGRLADAQWRFTQIVGKRVNLDRQHSPLLPTHLRCQDSLGAAPGVKHERRGVHLHGQGEEDHDDLGLGVLGRLSQAGTRPNRPLVQFGGWNRSQSLSQPLTEFFLDHVTSPDL